MSCLCLNKVHMGFVIWTNIFILVLEKKINTNNLRLIINITKRKVIYEKTLLSWENSFLIRMKVM